MGAKAIFPEYLSERFPTPSRKSPSGVYIIEFESGEVKVGITGRLYNRLNSLNPKGEPVRRVIAFFEIDDPGERLALEKRFFDLFYYHRVDGWEDRFTSAEPIERILLSKIYE